MALKRCEKMRASPMMPKALSAPSGEAAARFVRTALAHLSTAKLKTIPSPSFPQTNSLVRLSHLHGSAFPLVRWPWPLTELESDPS